MVRTPYQQAVIALLEAADHKVEHKPRRDGTLAWHIDDEPFAVDLREGEDVYRVNGGRADNYLTVWRARRFTGNPKKDAAMLLERHRVALAVKAREDAARAREAEREAKEDALLAAFGAPGAAVDVDADGVTLRFRVDDLTTEQAARLGEAINGVLRST